MRDPAPTSRAAADGRWGPQPQLLARACAACDGLSCTRHGAACKGAACRLQAVRCPFERRLDVTMRLGHAAITPPALMPRGGRLAARQSSFACCALAAAATSAAPAPTRPAAPDLA